LKSESMVGKRFRWRLILRNELLSDSMALVVWLILRISGGKWKKGGGELVPVGLPAAADVGDADFPADGRGAVALEGLPESIARQMAEGQIRVVLVVVFFDEQEAGGEAVAELSAPRDALGRGEALVDEVEGGGQCGF
jgi:hypothetical protein